MILSLQPMWKELSHHNSISYMSSSQESRLHRVNKCREHSTKATSQSAGENTVFSASEEDSSSIRNV